MLTISAKVSYGLAAVFDLAQNYNGDPVQIKTISENQDIPQQYLEQLMIKLKQSGIVKSFRGASGGYILIKDPAEITVYEIILCFEGPIELINTSCKSEVLKNFWTKTENDIRKYFQVTIQELILEQKRFLNRIEYSI